MSDSSNSAAAPAQNQTRILDTWITRQEKKVLLWLAARMPAWVVPDTLTGIGLFASVLIFAAYALTLFDKGFLWLASFAFVLNWFGDSLDGTLARYRKIERPRYGFYIDHIIDAVSEALVFIGLGLSPYLRLDVALLALVSYLMASVYIYLTTITTGVFRISYSGVSPTEFRLIAIATNTLVFFAGNPNLRIPTGGILPAPLSISLFDLVVIGVTILILYLFVTNALATGASLSGVDRAAYKAKKTKERTERIAKRQARREAQLLRKAAARQARSRTRVLIE